MDTEALGYNLGYISKEKAIRSRMAFAVNSFNFLVRMIGLEPTLPLQELEPKSSASANFATSAHLNRIIS